MWLTGKQCAQRLTAAWKLTLSVGALVFVTLRSENEA